MLRVKITNFESGKADEERLYEVSEKGTDKTYVEFMSPRDKGRHMLMLGDDMWVYLPDTCLLYTSPSTGSIRATHRSARRTTTIFRS